MLSCWEVLKLNQETSQPSSKTTFIYKLNVYFDYQVATFSSIILRKADFVSWLIYNNEYLNNVTEAVNHRAVFPQPFKGCL